MKKTIFAVLFCLTIILMTLATTHIATATLAPSNASKVITWATNPQYPPYDWAVDEKAYKGAAPELLSLIIPKGYTLKAVMVPWKRAQEMAKAGKIDLLVNLRITPERSTWLTFSKNPTFYNPIVVFMKHDKAIPFQTWDELKPMLGGVSIGDTYGNGFDEYLAKNLKTETSKTMVENFNKLNTGRIDYFVSGYYMGMAWLSSAGLNKQIVALQPPISNNSIHLGFSKKSPHRSLLPAIDKKLAALQKQGTLDHILQKYLKQFTKMPLKNFPN